MLLFAGEECMGKATQGLVEETGWLWSLVICLGGVKEWCVNSVMPGNWGTEGWFPRSPLSGLGLRLEQLAAFYVVILSLSKSRVPSLPHWTTLSWDSLSIKWGHMKPKYSGTL